MSNEEIIEIISEFREVSQKCSSVEGMNTLALAHIALMLSAIVLRMPEPKNTSQT